jgi:hypothetical protein
MSRRGPTVIPMVFGPALDAAGLLARVEIDKPFPAWARVGRAWSRMPAATHLPGKIEAGMTPDEAFAAEAEKLDAFAEKLRDHFARHNAMETELRALREQRDAVRAFFGVGVAPETPPVVKNLEVPDGSA